MFHNAGNHNSDSFKSKFFTGGASQSPLEGCAAEQHAVLCNVSIIPFHHLLNSDHVSITLIFSNDNPACHQETSKLSENVMRML